MKTFIRENPTITFGLGLPVLLMMAFLLMSGLPTLLVAGPTYDLLFATGYNRYQQTLQISVIDQRVQVIDQGTQANYQRPRLWRYNAHTGAVQEIAFIVPVADNTAANPVKRIELPDLEGVTVDSSSIAPDGYEFSTLGRSSSNLFAGLFYLSGSNRGAVLLKNGRRIRLPEVADHYYRGQVHFIGWVTP
ncbi:hypothetical protein Q4488_13085 [Amphritea sp. 1_MG-2023]|uniref:hypothetical protein n=1 Tax=Amphritea sp. 1_MG-2023 TaxID=3062670 RepID=UPI0026E1E645|nr:hypothetical protein [Amphritea sp. 1_MG-2023]MDO6564323.1 hypothetical protein [Amphritea sp. 1_MG-2023]